MHNNRVHFALDGRVYIVTGGSQGIGEACVRRLLADGASVAVWDVADETGTRLVGELQGAGL